MFYDRSVKFVSLNNEIDGLNDSGSIGNSLPLRERHFVLHYNANVEEI